MPPRFFVLVVAWFGSLACSAFAQTDEAVGQGTISLRGTGYVFTASPAGGGVYTLLEEVSSGASVQRLGGRSATARLVVSCASHQTDISDILVFTGPGGAGKGVAMKASAWMRSSPIDLLDLNLRLCARAAAGEIAPAAASASEQPPVMAAIPSATSAPIPVSAEPPTSRSKLAAHDNSAAADHWIQLGAFDSASLAQSAWTRIGGTSADLQGREHKVEPVAQGGGQLFRLLAGPYPSRAAAQAACLGVKASGGACLVR